MFEPPVYTIPRKENLPAMDQLRAVHFSSAIAAPLFETVDGEGAMQATTVQLIHDREYLYAWFDAEEQLPLCTYRDHDAPLYEENVVELFLDPQGKGKIYYELEVNPLNTRFDALIINDYGTNGVRRGKRFQGFPSWNPASFDSRTYVEQNRWQTAIKIAFADLFLGEFVTPSPGDTWKGNFLRVDFDGTTQQFYSWSPNGVADFHNTARFGILKFE